MPAHRNSRLIYFFTTKIISVVEICKRTSLNLSQFVEGRRWWPWAREGREAAYVFAGDEPCTGEEICRASARFYVLQTVIAQFLAVCSRLKWSRYRTKS